MGLACVGCVWMCGGVCVNFMNTQPVSIFKNDSKTSAVQTIVERRAYHY